MQSHANDAAQLQGSPPPREPPLPLIMEVKTEEEERKAPKVREADLVTGHDTQEQGA